MNSTGSGPRLLEGKTMLVTGAGRGIGRAHAIELARQGAHIVVNDLGTDVRGGGTDGMLANQVVTEIEKAGGIAVASHDDVSSWSGSLAAVRRAIDTFGTLDGLVNNAGALRKVELADLAEDDFDALVDVHLKGSFGCAHHALAYWRERHRDGAEPRAAIVSTFSEAALVSLPGYAAYGAAKAGIVQLTTVGSREAGAYGVRLNAYAPRAVTRMTRGVGDDNADADDPMAPANSSPLVVWLLSELSLHVTGQVFQTVGGGIARCSPWSVGEMVWPSGDRYRFDPHEIGNVLNARVFGCRFPELGLADPPGSAARLACPADASD